MRFPVVAVTLLATWIAVPHVAAQDFAWVAAFGESQSIIARKQIDVDEDGNVYTVGVFIGTADFDPGPGTAELTSAGDWDVFISKLDRSGNFVWAKRIGGSGLDWASDVTVGDSVHIAGRFDGIVDFDPGPGTHTLNDISGSAFVLKLTRGGELVWVKQMGSSYAEAVGVRVTKYGSVLVVGNFSFSGSWGSHDLTSAGGSDVFVAKLWGDGSLFSWARRLGGPGADVATGMGVGSNTRVYAVGYFEGVSDFDPSDTAVHELTSMGGDDAFISCLDSQGTFKWAASAGGPMLDRAYAVVPDDDGLFYVVGQFSDTADFDPGPGSYTMTASGTDAFVWTLFATGEAVQALQLGGPNGGTIAQDVGLDDDGNLYVGGFFAGTTDFDPGPGTFELTSVDAYDVFIAKLEQFPSSFRWAGKLGGVETEQGGALAIDASGNVYVAGNFDGSVASTVDFDPGPAVHEVANTGSSVFVCKLTGCDTPAEENVYGSLLFSPVCTARVALDPAGGARSTSSSFWRGAGDRFFLSSVGDGFAPLVVDDVVQVSGADVGLGPYATQPGVPPYRFNAPIDDSLVPLPAHEIPSAVIPPGLNAATVELLDTDGLVFGNTPVYLVRDCGLWVAGDGPDAIHWVSHDDQAGATPPDFDIRYGLLSDLSADADFSKAVCLGRFADTPATTALPDPPPGDGLYYLARGISGCVAQGYGDSSLALDPRDELDVLRPCP